MKNTYIHNARTRIYKNLKLYIGDNIKFKGKNKKEFKFYDNNDTVVTISR